MSDIPVYGNQPALVGQALEALIAQSFVFAGQTVSTANVVFLQASGRWYRLALDAGTVHWKVEPEEPKPWSVPEERWFYPHRAVGEEFGLVGVPITSATLQEEGPAIKFVLSFKNGKRFVLSNVNDSTSFHVA
jgi:hypothetical protein